MKKIAIRIITILVLLALARNFSPLGEDYTFANLANVVFFVAVFYVIDVYIEKLWP